MKITPVERRGFLFAWNGRGAHDAIAPSASNRSLELRWFAGGSRLDRGRGTGRGTIPSSERHGLAEARVSVLAFLASATLLTWITPRSPKTRTLRLIHTRAVLKKNAEGVMKKTCIAALAAATLLLGSMSLDVRATTIYGWLPVDEEPFILFPYGQIEVTDTAQLSGSLNYGFFHYGEGAADPHSPLIEYQFEGHILHPRVDDSGDWIWSIEADVLFGDFLRGSLSINDGENSYWMNTSGDGKLWTISNFLSDNPDTGCYEAPCSGATGYWELASGPEPSPVPEPDLFATFGFLAFGLLGADAARRWRRAHL